MSDSALSSRPKYDQLIELLDTLVSWQKFGTFLPGIKSEHIQVIECENRRIDQQKSALLTKWLSVHPEASWQDVTSALEKAQERYLATEIYQKLNALHQLMLQSPTIPSTSQVPHIPVKSISLESKEEEDEIRTTLKNLHSNFSDLMVAVRSAFDHKLQCQQLVLVNFTRWIEHQMKWVGQLSKVTDLNDIFMKIAPYFDFLDCELIVDMSEKFLDDLGEDKALISELKEHKMKAEALVSLSTVEQLKTQLKSIFFPHLSNLTNMPQIYIELHSKWNEATIDALYRLIGQLLPHKSKQSILKHIEIGPGSVIIKYIVLEFQADCLIAYAKGKLQFMRLIGIFYLTINGEPILEENENMNFSFDMALVEAAKVGHVEAAQFLLDIGADINVVLIEAGRIGHNEAAQFLLEWRSTTLPNVKLDLDEVLHVLERSNFSPSNWFSLGLSLNLPTPTLVAIKVEHSNNVSQCLQECLSQWLNKTDNVVEKEPTWSSLAYALRSIGEVASASNIEIKTELSHPACQILLKHYERLSQLILPVETLLTEGVICKEVFHELKKSGGLLVNSPLRSLCTTMSKDHKQLKVFASILLQSRETIQVAQFILEEYEFTFSSSHPPQQSEANTEISCFEKGERKPSGTETTIDQMRMYFSTLFNTVARLIEDKVPSLEDLKTYLQKHFDELRLQLEYAESLKQLMFLMKDKDTIIDINCIQAIVNHLDIEEVKDHITAYKITMEEFCEETTLDICCNESFSTASSSLLKCETIEFVLEWEANKHSLNDIKDLLQKAFKDLSKKLQVRYILIRNNSIIITCHAPQNITDILLIEGEKNLDMLKEIGLNKLIIGYYTIWDKKKVADLESIVQRLNECNWKDVQEDKAALEKQLEAAYQLLQEKESEVERLKSTLKKHQESESLLTTRAKMDRAKILHIEQLEETLRRKEAIEKELLSVSSERQKEIETLQEIITKLTQQLSDKDKQIEELKKSLKDLAFISKARKPFTNQEFEEVQTKSSQEEITSSTSEKETGKVEWFDDISHVRLTSPTTEQCEDVMSVLMEEQLTGKKWWINLVKSLAESVLVIFNSLSKCAVRSLYLVDTPLDDTCVSTLSEILRTKKALKTLSLTSSPVTGGIEQIIDALSTNNSLEKLLLWHIALTDEDTTHLSDMLGVNKMLKVLVLVNCNIDDDGIQRICAGLAKNETLIELDINNNSKITSASANTIIKLIETTTSLTELHLHNTSLKDDDIKTICNTLTTNDTIQTLRLSKQHQNDCEKLDSYQFIKDRLLFSNLKIK